MRGAGVLLLFAGVLALAACAAAEPEGSVPAAGSAVAAELGPVTYDDHGMPVGLHQFNPYSDRVTSGAQPEGEEAFRNLAALGFRTVLSVDGSKPDVELARKHGLRYVHVPMQYSGVRPEELAQIVRAIETSDGPVYAHCHHGKHRSPAALGAACVSMGLLTPEQAVAEMKVSGTDPKYAGLFRDVQAARPLTAEQRAALPDVLPECVAPEGLAAAMVDVDLRWEHMKSVRDAKWAPPAEHPDIDPPHEARILWEHYREMARLSETKEHGDGFAKVLAEAESAAKALEDALRAKDATAAEAAFARSAKACSVCHKSYRDN